MGIAGVAGCVLAPRQDVGSVSVAVAWLVGGGVVAATWVGTSGFDPHPGTLRSWLWMPWLAAPAVLSALASTARFFVLRGRAPRSAWGGAATVGTAYLGLLLRASIVAQPPAVEGRFVELAVTDRFAYTRTEDGRVLALEPAHEIPGRYRALRGDALGAVAIDDAGRVVVLRDAAQPEALAIDPPARSIAATPSFACAVDGGGRVVCFRRVPVAPPAAPPAPSPAGGAEAPWHPHEPQVDPHFEDAGEVHASEELVCAIERGGRVRCRPGGHEGAENVMFARSNAPGYVPPRERPGVVLLERGARGVAVTRSSVCVIDAEAKVQCAGSDAWSELGRSRQPTPDASLAPVPGLAHVEQLVAGAFHVCARLAGGAVSCWGGNGWRQLGVEGPERRHTPERIALPGAAQELFRHARSTCARLEDGRFFCWGAQLVPGNVLHGAVCDTSFFGPPSVCSATPLEVQLPETYVPAR